MNTLTGTRPRAPTALRLAQRLAEDVTDIALDRRDADEIELARLALLRARTERVYRANPTSREVAAIRHIVEQLVNMDQPENSDHQRALETARKLSGSLERTIRKFGDTGDAA